jgi:hypothetical protein
VSRFAVCLCVHTVGVIVGMSFHTRALPAPALPFASHEGKDIFRQAMADGLMEGYFHLAPHFLTQGMLNYCTNKSNGREIIFNNIFHQFLSISS